MLQNLQQTKLAYIAQKLGFDINQSQQTHRRVYDTLDLGPGINTYFENFAGKTIAQTNLTSNKLDSAEALVIKQIGITDVAADQFALKGALLSVFVGGQTVVKKLPLQILTAGPDPAVHVENLVDNASNAFDLEPNFRLLTNIVVPPQVSFTVTVELPAGSSSESNLLYLDGYGILFNPQTSL
jgi:hypothetical protein